MNRSQVEEKKKGLKGAIRLGMISAGLLACATAGALGLGEIIGEAQIGKPLDSTIDIVGEGKDFDIDLVQVRRVSNRDAENYGFEIVGPYFPLTLNVRENKGDAFVEITSKEPINEPFLEFMVELYWPTGNVIRQYLVLPSQPPVIADTQQSNYRWQDRVDSQSGPARTSASSNPAPGKSPITTVATPQDSGGPVINPGDRTYVVERGDLLSTIARNWGRTTGQSSKQLTLASTKWLLDNNPEVFPNGNPNDLEVGSVLVLPPSIELSPLASLVGDQRVSTDSTDSNRNSNQSNKVVLQSQPLALTEQMDQIQVLNAQVEISKRELGRLRHENQSFRRRIQALETNSFNQALANVDIETQIKVEKLKEQQELEAKPRAVPAGRRTDEELVKGSNSETSASDAPVTETSVVAQAETATTDSQSSSSMMEQVSSTLEKSKWTIMGGAGIVALLALLVVRRRQSDEPDDFESVEQEVTSPVDEVSLATSDQIEMPEEDHADTEDEYTPLPDVVSEADEKDWMDRKFGSTANNEDQVDSAQPELVEEIAPYSKDKLDMMPWANEEEVPQFELDEELLETLESDDVAEEVADTVVEAVDTVAEDINSAEEDIAESMPPLGETPTMIVEESFLPHDELEEISFDTGLSDIVTHLESANIEEVQVADEIANEEDDMDSDQGLISEIEMYIQLGKQEKASRLLAQLLDDVSVDQNDPRIQSLVEQCLPKQA